MKADSQREKGLLADIYRAHHRAKGRSGFTYGGSEKGEIFAKWVGTGRDVLDLGCRDGALTRFYAVRNRITGVDVDREALSECQRALGIATRWFNVSDRLPFDDSSFDVVVASELLEHLPWPNIVVGEIARVLRPGGLFIGSVPNAFRLKNRLLFLVGQEYEVDPTHLRRFSIQTLAELLAHSFTEIQVIPAFGRFVWIHGPLFANTLLWRCKKP